MSLSTPPPPLPEDGKLEAIGETIHQVEPEKEKQTVESNEPSTVASSAVNGVEKPEFPEDDGPATKEKAVDEPQEPVGYPSGVEVLFIMLALVLSITLISLDQTIVVTAIPKITDRFDSLDDISWYGSAYFMTLGAFQSLWGKVYKYFPLKTSFLVAIFIFELGSLICAVAQNSTTLIVGRAIAGLGASGIAPGVYTISAFAAEPTKRATYTGVIGASYGVAAVAGPLIGGGLTDAASWRWCFYINLPIGGLAAFTILLTFKTPKAAKLVDATLKEKLLHMDFLGTVLIMGASLALLLALQYGGVTHAWDSSVVIGLLVGFVVMVLALIILEIWQGERAMLTPRLMRQRTVWVNGVWGFFFAGSYFVTLYYLPIYFQSIDNVSPIGSGVRNIPLIIMFSIATYASGKAITKTGIATPYLTAGSVVVTIAAGLLYTLDIGTSTGKWVGYQILAGFGYGIAFQVPVIVAQAFAAPSDIAPTTAIIIFCRSVGGTFLIAAAQSGFVNQLVHKLANTAPSVNPALVTATGATELHQVFSGAELDGVVRAYAWGIKVAFAITIGACGVTFPVSLCSKWKNVNAKKPSDGGA
ncbi:MFS general substrate transporter [Zopfia rhizophila CBS 207.26]|uniref:MFS general substrate transporter n=1 Tax=Zopfia rhizophila CBS 207.26 TaxID=1314779 RepID=A0A6A6DKG4_9PEZI|nr:MFS general substrate transporter [Zopfia rhizophila CBS 207.26]